MNALSSHEVKCARRHIVEFKSFKAQALHSGVDCGLGFDLESL